MLRTVPLRLFALLGLQPDCKHLRAQLAQMAVVPAVAVVVANCLLAHLFFQGVKAHLRLPELDRVRTMIYKHLFLPWVVDQVFHP